MSDINITVQDEIVNIDVLDTPVYVEVTNSPGPAGPAGVGIPVGGTTGQVLAKNSATNYDTAWVNASGGGVPYSGATGNVNLGEYELKAGQLTLDVSPTGTAAVGTTRWNDTLGSSETTLKGGSVILKNGVDLVARVVNKVTPNTTLTKAAYQAVRVSGAQGQRLAVAFAQANNDNNSADTIGLVIETIATNQEGFIITVGQIENINTTGSLQGETWVDGDVLYLSPTIAGAITNVKPNATVGHIVVIGYVEYAHANNGKIYVKVMNGWELGELHDVSIVSVANNEALIYESSSALWKNKSIPTALGYTPANAATTLTINGVTYDLSTSRTWTIAAGISGSGTSGQVTYWSGASAVSGSADLTLDTTLGRLNLTKSVNGTAAYYVTNSNVGGNAIASYTATNGTDTVSYGVNGTNKSAYGALTANNGFFYSTRGITFMADSAANGILQFATGGNTERMRIDVNGNVGIGVTPTVRLQVSGDTLLRGSGNSSATTALTVQNSDGSGILGIRNDGVVRFGNLVGGAEISATNGTDAVSLSAGSGLRFRSAINGVSATGFDFILTNYNGARTYISGNGGNQIVQGGFAPTSGTGTYAFLTLQAGINQTGGANGITRGLYVNPTLTAAADFRAIETARGNIVFSNLPTSSAGLPSGALWNNGGVINIV